MSESPLFELGGGACGALLVCANAVDAIKTSAEAVAKSVFFGKDIVSLAGFGSSGEA
jgi:hypothetical protein